MFTRTTWPPWPSWPLPPSVQAFSVHFRQRQPLEQATFGAFEWCLLLDPGCESWTSWTLIFIFITFVLFVLSQIRTKCCNMHWTYLQVRKKTAISAIFRMIPPILTISYHHHPSPNYGDVGQGYHSLPPPDHPNLIHTGGWIGWMGQELDNLPRFEYLNYESINSPSIFFG